MSDDNKSDTSEQALKLLQESKEFGKKFFDWFNDQVDHDWRLQRLMLAAVKREVCLFDQMIGAYEAALLMDLGEEEQ